MYEVKRIIFILVLAGLVVLTAFLAGMDFALNAVGGGSPLLAIANWLGIAPGYVILWGGVSLGALIERVVYYYVWITKK
jgi:hypothetical protein